MIAVDRADLVDRYIQLDPRFPHSPNRARLKKYGVSVWALIARYQFVGENIDEVAEAFDVPAEAVQAAVEFYHQHKAAIDGRIEENARITS